jgi:predicted N-acyltransferase
MSVRSRLKKDKFHYAQFTLSNIDQNLIRACGFQILEGNTYIARIADDPETVLSGYSKSTRKHVRRAINNGLAVEFTKDKSFIDIYYEQLCQVFDKSNMRPTYPKAKVEALWDCLMPSEKLLATQVSYDNAIIATRLDFFDGVYMHSFGSASEQNYLHLNPNELARYHVMSFAADNGIKYYDMTGGGSYKEKFGGEKTTITTVVYDPYGLLWFKEVAKKVYRLKFKFRRSKR